jgi:hypothetical protein
MRTLSIAGGLVSTSGAALYMFYAYVGALSAGVDHVAETFRMRSTSSESPLYQTLPYVSCMLVLGGLAMIVIDIRRRRRRGAGKTGADAQASQ